MAERGKSDHKIELDHIGRLKLNDALTFLRNQKSPIYHAIIVQVENADFEPTDGTWFWIVTSKSMEDLEKRYEPIVELILRGSGHKLRRVFQKDSASGGQ